MRRHLLTLTALLLLSAAYPAATSSHTAEALVEAEAFAERNGWVVILEFQSFAHAPGWVQ